MQALGVMLLLTAPACDFDIPDKFEMPTWFLDIKIPLVQKRYELGDLSNPDYNIFPTPDSMGFQIVYEAEFPFTSLDPENLKIDFPGGYMETVIPATEMPGIDASSLTLPEIPPIKVDIPLVIYELCRAQVKSDRSRISSPISNSFMYSTFLLEIFFCNSTLAFK